MYAHDQGGAVEAAQVIRFDNRVDEIVVDAMVRVVIREDLCTDGKCVEWARAEPATASECPCVNSIGLRNTTSSALVNSSNATSIAVWMPSESHVTAFALA